MELIEAAQKRLEEKRKRLKVTERNTPLTGFMDNELIEIIKRAEEKSKEVKYEEVPVYTLPEKETETIEPWERMGIPPLYKHATFDAFIGNETLVNAVKNCKTDMVLMGHTGCGKTHLAVSYLREKGNLFDRFLPVPELLLEIRDSYRNDSKVSEKEIIDKYSGRGLMVLDDLGSEKSTEFSIATLSLIIDRRIRDEKQTIITTNLSLKQVEERLSARIASRMATMKIIQINMPDYRKKRGK